jgi:hypothetical protein
MPAAGCFVYNSEVEKTASSPTKLFRTHNKMIGLKNCGHVSNWRLPVKNKGVIRLIAAPFSRVTEGVL